MRKLVKSDPATGTRTWLEWDGDTPVFALEQHVDAIVDANKSAQNDVGKGSFMRHRGPQKYAEIPAAIFWAKVKEFGWPRDNPQAWRDFVNHRDYRHFRTIGATI
jgi:hypothetical protein